MAAWKIFEMSIEGHEFQRLLTAAFGDQAFESSGEVFFHSEPERCWRIELQPLPARSLGVICLERQLVRWTFTGYTDEQMQALLDRFDRHSRRGGG